jgi:hypothetical protein
MANNVQIFNGALAGFLNGAEQSRNITSATSADYASTVNAAVAFATQVDAGIPADGAIVTPVTAAAAGKVGLITNICAGVIGGRFPTSAVAGDYATLAAACVALYTRGVTGLQ